MIALNITNAVVLRRVLEELESRIDKTVDVSPVELLPDTADLTETIAKVNELLAGFNALIGELSKGNSNQVN